MIEIKVNCKGSHYFKLTELFILQDTDDFQLKELSKDNFEKLKKRIEKKGFWFPFFVWHCKEECKWYYTDGTQRHKVLSWMIESGQYKFPETFPCVEIFAKDKKEAAEAILTQSTNYGKFTDEGLYGFLNEYGLTDDFADLKDVLELPDINLDEFEAGWIENENENDNEKDDDIPEPPLVAKAQVGDLYQLGRHWLLCGDATKKENVERLMDGEKVDMVFTDPPYGIKIVNINSKKVGGGGNTKFGKVGGGNRVEAKTYSEIIGDDTIETALTAYKLTVQLEIKNYILWGGNYFTGFLRPSPCWIIWDKENTGNFADIEMAWTSYPGGAKLYRWLWNGLSRKGDRDSELISRVHPTQKPVGLFVQIFNDFKFNSCLDLFGGSGSTLIACEKINRQCLMMELDPAYIDVIIQRWETFTGQKAAKL